MHQHFLFYSTIDPDIMKKLFGGVLAIVFLASCTSSSTEYKSYLSNPQLFSQVVYELNSVVMGNNFPPIVASRNYSYASIAAYEVIAAGNPARFNSLAGQINDLTAMPKPQGDKVNFELAAIS